MDRIRNGDARPVITEALESLAVETSPGISVASIGVQGATLATSEQILAATVVWCAGARAASFAGGR
ncbi:MAG: hypothetical protein ACT4O2_01130 [Beijerinckiaceae bacterium]